MTQKSTNPWLIAFVVSLATFMEVLDTTITNVSLQHIAGALAAGQEESTWVLTSYLVANAIILPLSGWLSDIMGRKRFLISCIVGFTVASFFCGTAMSLTSLIIFRILQGAAGGGLQPTQQAIVLDSFPPEKRGTVFAITGLTMIAAPIIGPTFGGLITDHISWRWIFYINIPVGIIATFLVWRLVDEDGPRKQSKNDFVGVGLVALGIAALQIVLDKGQQEDWFESPFIMIWALISFVCLVTAFIWLWGQKDPIIDLSLFKEKSFSLACILIFLTGFALYGASALIPLLVQSQFGYNATLAGLILSPAGLILFVLMPMAGKLISKMQARYMVFIGLSLISFGMFMTSRFSPQTDFNTFVYMRVLQVLGLPFLFISISTLAFSHIPKDKSNKASSLYSFFRNIGGSVGIALVGTYQARHAQVYRHQLSENLIPGSLNYEYYLKTAEAQAGSVPGALAHINQALQRQAEIAAYAETFLFMAIILLTAFCIALFVLPATRPAASTPLSEH